MHELYHIVGICPDSFGHLDLMDLVIANYCNFIDFLKYIKTICF